MPAIIKSDRKDAVAKRIKRMADWLGDWNNFKVISDAHTDTIIPLLVQYGIDVVGWLELNTLAEHTDFTDFGRQGISFVLFYITKSK